MDNSLKERKDFLNCLVAGLYFLFAFANLNIINSISSELISFRELNNFEVGFLSSVYLYAIAIFFIPSGILLDKFSTRNLMLTGMGISVIFSFLFIFSKNFYLLVLIRFILGVMHTIGFLGSIRVATLGIKKDQVFKVGIVVSLGIFGGLLVQSPMVLLIEHFGWKSALLALSSLGLLIWLLMYFLLDKQNPTSKKITLPSFKEWFFNTSKIFKKTTNWFCAFYTCFLNAPIITLGALWGDKYLEINKNFSFIDSSYIISSMYFGVLIGSIAIGWISDKLSKDKLLMLVGFVFSIVLLAMIIFMRGNYHFYLIWILFFLLGVFICTQNLSYKIISNINSLANNSTAIGIASVIIMGGGALIQMIFTSLTNQTQNFNIPLIYILIVLLLSFFMSFFIKIES